MSYSVVIVEDEVLLRKDLERMVNRYCQDATIVDAVGTVAAGIKAITNLKPDMVFLDIQLEDGISFDILKEIKDEVKTKIIFVTAHSDYALEAIKKSAIDYVLKPVDPDDLEEAYKKAVEEIEKERKSVNDSLRLKQNHLLEEAYKDITESINYAKRIQDALLPSQELLNKVLPNNFVIFRPKDVVAGDFYWVDQVDNHIFFAVADCTGHGVPGAIISVICNNSLNRSVNEFGLVKPADILDKTRELVISEFAKSEQLVRDGMDIALCMLDVNNTEQLHFAGANNPIWIRRNKEIIEVKGDRQPVGNFENQHPFTNHVVDVFPGDGIYLFSDGFSDQFGGPKGKKYKASRFKTLCIDSAATKMKDQGDQIDQCFVEWKGDYEQIDDVCVIGVNI